ncbi:helix-turn-helix domain-containing protein, partial [Desulfofundulus sp.]
MPRTRTQEVNTIQSVERAIKILEYLCRGPASLSEISRELGLHKSTAF